MFIGTAIGIITVDFNVWPERFGKTHKYGISVMDIGTSFFVISMALAEYYIVNIPNRSSKTTKKYVLSCFKVF